MKPLLVAALAAALVSCAGAPTPGWRASEIGGLEVRDLPMSAAPPRHVTGADLEVVVACMGRAARVDDREAWRGARYYVDVVGSGRAAGRWQYDATRGRLVRLSMKAVPSYQLDEPCRAEVERRLLAPTVAPR